MEVRVIIKQDDKGFQIEFIRGSIQSTRWGDKKRILEILSEEL